MRNAKDDAGEAARLLKAMAHPARVRLLRGFVVDDAFLDPDSWQV